MRELSYRWAGMTSDEKAGYKGPGEAIEADADASASDILENPPAAPLPLFLEAADDFYPIRCDMLADVTGRVSHIAKQMQEHNDRVIGSRNPIPPQETSCCADEWGVGHCQTRIPEEEKCVLKVYKRQMKTWSTIYKLQKATHQTDWGKTPLLYSGVLLARLPDPLRRFEDGLH